MTNETARPPSSCGAAARRRRATGKRLAGLLTAAWLVASGPAGANDTIVRPDDTNSRITVVNAIPGQGETTLLFFTWPDLGDPESGKPCPVNYYSVTVGAGLARPRVASAARGVCGGLGQKSRLLDDGTVSIVVRDRWEKWRDGGQQESKTFASLEPLAGYPVTTDTIGPQVFDLSGSGSLAIALVTGSQSRSLTVFMLKPDGELLWKAEPEDIPADLMEAWIWAGPQGNALARIDSPAEGAALLVFDRNGGETRHVLATGNPMFATEKIARMNPQEAQAYFQGLSGSEPESVERFAARADHGGGWDVLFQRGGPDDRAGQFLVRIGPDGQIRSETALGEVIAWHGIDDWVDFYVNGRELVLLSKEPVIQKVVNRVPKRWGQNIVSWIDLSSQVASPHLLPLDERYLEAALAAGDEDLQYLPGMPGSDPALLSRLGGQPLVASVGWVAQRQVLRLHEASQDLRQFTDVAGERQAREAKAAAREQRNATRDALAADVQAAQARAAGMSVEQFQQLSKDEQTEAIIRNGGTDQLMQTMMQKSQEMQAAAPATETPGAGGAPQDVNAQIAAAMARAQEQMANNPNVTPEMRAQMQAMMAQMGQGAGGSAAPRTAVSGSPPPAGGGSSPPSSDTLAVDAGLRGFVEFEREGGEPVTLRIYNRTDGTDLLNKDYPDGVIYEYIDFSQFDLPLEQIGVAYREPGGRVLRDLTPAVKR